MKWTSVDLIKTIKAMMQLIRRCWVNSRMKWVDKKGWIYRTASEMLCF